jgi:prevent-host-death family protein
MQVTIHEAKTQLSRLIAAAERGEEVIIARRDKPVVRLSMVEEFSGKTRIGGLKGRKFKGSPGHLVGCVRMSIDFKAARNPVCDCLEVGEISVSPCAAACELQ